MKNPRVRKIYKKMTARVITKGDIENVLGVIERERLNGLISEGRAKQFTAITIFGAFTGQRVYSTTKQLRVQQFGEALKLKTRFTRRI